MTVGLLEQVGLVRLLSVGEVTTTRHTRYVTVGEGLIEVQGPTLLVLVLGKSE